MPDSFCPACGRAARDNDRYCRGCGGVLTDGARALGAIDEAESLVARGLLDEAIATVQRAIGIGETAELQVALSTLYLRRGGQKEARRALDRALQIDSGCAVAHAYVGGMLIHAGQVHEAHVRLDLARDLAPDDLIVLIKRAEFWLRLGIFDNARQELRHGLQNGGGSPQVRAMAETMFAAIERKSRGSFTRKLVSLPSLGALKNVIKHTPKAGTSAAEVEA